jgi:hypothetical protein
MKKKRWLVEEEREAEVVELLKTATNGVGL